MLYVFRSLFVFAVSVVCATTQAADPLQAFLDQCADRYSEEQQMLGQEFRSPGYHTTVASGTWVHPVLPSLDYALGLLQRNSPGDGPRAQKIILRVIGLQDADPASRTYGIWPWLLEEPLEKMSPPDWNWADFCGARLAVMLANHGPSLSDALQQAMRTSLRHAALAIKKRDVGPGYTNIAIMGGGVCAAAGEILDEAELMEYGRQRLQRVAEHSAHHGGFNEYNSPTYTMVALAECERTLHLVRDEATRRAAESLRRVAWQTIADSYHPGTGQWAGPHARSYSDYLFPRTAAYLTEQTGTPIPVHPQADQNRVAALPVPWCLPCPDELRDRFRSLPSETCELQRTFVRGTTPERSTIGTSWLTADICLGSVNRGTFWTQCRPLIGSWKTERDPAVVLRLRFLHDGQDFASMGVVTAQAGGQSLAIAYPLRNRPGWVEHVNRPQTEAIGIPHWIVLPMVGFPPRTSGCGLSWSARASRWSGWINSAGGSERGGTRPSCMPSPAALRDRRWPGRLARIPIAFSSMRSAIKDRTDLSTSRNCPKSRWPSAWRFCRSTRRPVSPRACLRRVRQRGK